MSEHGDLKQVLAPVLRVLKDLGGKFVFTDEEGATFVLMSKKELLAAKAKQEQQLPLPPAQAVEAAVRQHAPDLADDIIEAINRDIALSQDNDEGRPDLALPLAPIPKLRFEPLRGDLPPELQE